MQPKVLIGLWGVNGGLAGEEQDNPAAAKHTFRTVSRELAAQKPGQKSPPALGKQLTFGAADATTSLRISVPNYGGEATVGQLVQTRSQRRYNKGVIRNHFESVAQPGPNPPWSAKAMCGNADPGTRNHYWA